jgi:hypothetical protein
MNLYEHQKELTDKLSKIISQPSKNKNDIDLLKHRVGVLEKCVKLIAGVLNEDQIKRINQKLDEENQPENPDNGKG